MHRSFVASQLTGSGAEEVGAHVFERAKVTASTVLTIRNKSADFPVIRSLYEKQIKICPYLSAFEGEVSLSRSVLLRLHKQDYFKSFAIIDYLSVKT